MAYASHKNPASAVQGNLQGEILLSYVTTSIETFLLMGFSAEQLLKHSQFTLEDLRAEPQDSIALVNLSELLTIYQNAFAVSNMPNLGLEFGKQVSIGIYGIISFAMLSSKTDIDAVHLAIKYQRLILANLATLSLNVEGSAGSVSLALHTDDKQLVRFFVEQLFASCIVFNETLSGQKSRIHELRLTYDDTGYAQAYESIFNCPVVFNCSANEMLFDPGVLDISLPNMNPATTQACTDVCDELLDKLMHQSSVAYRLANLLRSDFSNYADMAVAARYFNCDQRTLRRKLTQEDTSFRAVRDNVCQQLAVDLLKQELSVCDVAIKLGYSSPRTFRNAFTAWTGSAPSHYLKRLG